MNVPLFPLNSIVCPGGRIPLRVFEARYLDMVSDCLKKEAGFVIVMLRDADDARKHGSRFYDVGTLVRVVDFGSELQNGVLSLTVEGQCRVHIESAAQQENGLWTGLVNQMSEEDFVSLPERYQDLKAVLKALVRHPLIEELNMEIDFQDGRQVGLRLTELLPLGNRQKQYLFELEDPIFRLEEIAEQLSTMVS
jgi:hypothetical protein